jgi:hypothetical protein
VVCGFIYLCKCNETGGKSSDGAAGGNASNSGWGRDIAEDIAEEGLSQAGQIVGCPTLISCFWVGLHVFRLLFAIF